MIGTFITGIEDRLYARLEILRDDKEQMVQEAAATTGRSLVVVKAEQVKHDFELSRGITADPPSRRLA